MREDQEVRRYPGFSVWLVSKPAKRKPLRIGRFLAVTWRWLAGYKEPRVVRDARIESYSWLGLAPLDVTLCGDSVVFVRRAQK